MNFWNNPYRIKTITILILALFCNNMSVKAVDKTSLVAYWAFDETNGSSAIDSSGNGNLGTLMGNATFAPGKIGNAVNLDGTNSGVDIPDLSFPGDFTIAAWVYLRGAVFNDDVLIGQTLWGGQDINFCCPGLRLYTGSTDAITASSAVLSDVWTHCAITRSGSTLKLYLNGILDATSSGFAATFITEAIGRSWSTTTDGLIDEMYLFDRALSDNEISQLYSADQILTDTIPPSAPTGLSFSNASLNGFRLSWNAATDNTGIDSYEVFQDGVSIGTTTNTFMQVSGLSCGTSYSMSVKARDYAGIWSIESNTFDATTFDCNIDSIDISIDPQREYQQIRGLGAAIADWLYGENNYSTHIDNVVNDLGLSMVRLFLKTEFESVNDNNDPNTPGTFNTGQISDQIQVLDKLKQAGLKNVVLSIFSPPAWMKTNGSIIGGELRTDMYDEFAEFYSEYIKLIEQHGLNVYAISPENEPRWAQSYGSCVYSPEQLRDIIDVLGKRFEKEGLQVKIFSPEDVVGFAWQDYTNLIMEDSVASKYSPIVAIHHQNVNFSSAGSYKNYRDYLASFYPDDSLSLDLWNSEISGYSDGWDGAFNMAKGFMTSLKDGKMNAIIFGSISIASGLGLDKEALMVNRVPTKRYYIAKQYIRFIRPDAVMIKCTDDISKGIWAAAFKQGKDSRLTVVAINDSDEPKTVRLKMANAPKKYVHYLTTAFEDCVLNDTVLGSSVILHPNSVNTFVAEGTNHLPTIDNVKNRYLLMGQNNSYEIDLSGISDGDSFTQNLDVSVLSSNPDLIPTPVLDYTAGQTTGTLAIEPQPNQSGTSTITVTLQDDGGQDNNGFFSKQEMSFDVHVLPFINQKPTIDSIPDQNVEVGDGEQTITITGISDGNTGTQNITFTETRSNNNLIRNTKIHYNKGENTAQYIYTPRSIGMLTVTLTLTDDGDNHLGGTNETTTSFNINVSERTGVEALSSNGMMIYPNPASNIITIKTQEWMSGFVKVEICNLNGNTLLSMKEPIHGGIIKIPTDKLDNGVYIVKVTSGENMLTSKILIKK